MCIENKRRFEVRRKELVVWKEVMCKSNVWNLDDAVALEGEQDEINHPERNEKEGAGVFRLGGTSEFPSDESISSSRI